MSVPKVDGEWRNGLGAHALPLVLLPGTLCDARVFEPLLADPVLRARDARVIALPAATAMAAAAAEIVDRLPERCALLGFSLGGIVALHAATRAPERVAALALVSTTPGTVPARDRIARRLNADPDATALRAIVEHDLHPRYFGHATGQAEHRDLVRRMAAALGGGVLRRQTDLALDRPDARPLLPAIRCPTLVIGGGEDRINPPAVQRDMAAALPDAALTIVPGAGHFVTLEAPHACAVAIDSWLARAETASHVPMEKTA